MEKLLLIAGYFCLARGAPFVAEDRSEQQLTTIPADILNNVTQLQLNKNNIEEINSTAYYPVLDRFYINDNLLLQFPNFCILNQTLLHIQIGGNLMSFVDPVRLDCLHKLKTLHMGRNKLSAIPAVDGMASSLGLLGISDNLFTEVPRMDVIGPKVNDFSIGNNPIDLSSFSRSFKYANLEKIGQLWVNNLNLNQQTCDETVVKRLSSLLYVFFQDNDFTEMPDLSASKDKMIVLDLNRNPITFLDVNILRKYWKLRTLTCRWCQLTAVPNACSINNNPPLTLHLESNPFICDYPSKWLIPAYNAGAVAVSTTPCLGSPHLAAVDKNSLVPADFEAMQGKLKSITMDLLNPYNFRCRSVIGQLDVLSGMTPIDCVTNCRKIPACLAVGYHGNNQTCMLYGPGSGVVNIPETDFFIMQ